MRRHDFVFLFLFWNLFHCLWFTFFLGFAFFFFGGGGAGGVFIVFFFFFHDSRVFSCFSFLFVFGLLQVFYFSRVFSCFSFFGVALVFFPRVF